MTRVPMTVVGSQQLKDELDRLKFKERPRIIAAIAEARGHGDLKENAEYHAAKEQQSFVEGRIREVESKLSYAQVIDITKIPHSGKVIFGSTVSLINKETNEKVTYQIVGDDEADLKAYKISVNSPIARALIAKSQHDIVIVKAPSGEIEYEISQIAYK